MLRFLDFLKPARMVVAAYGAEAVASARQMREGGAKYPAIAEATGIAKLDLHSILPIAPKKIKNTRPRVSEIDKAEFVRLRQQGRTYAQIAEATGHSRQAVSRHCQVLLDGWEAQELTHRALSKARVTLIGDRHAERNNQILELRRIGLSYPAIATQVGCNYGVVSYVCQFKTSGKD